MVSDSLVQEIRERADILEVVSEHVSLKRSGKTYRGPCPLHGGEGPNFSVDPTRGIFKCFVCGEGGDVFSFLMKHLGLDFPSAVRHVASRVGIEVPEEGASRQDPYDYLREVTAFAEEWFGERLRDEDVGRAARAYLSSRGIDLESAERFGLGFAPDEWRGLREAAETRGIGEDLLLEAGLLATSERADEPYDRFRNRLTFSIRDLRDRPLAFGGRVLGPGDSRVPKYINSPETPIFRKGRTLYGLTWARHAMRREEHGLVAEGYMDVVSLHIHGFSTAVASLGTAFTAEQAELMARYAKRAYLLYDSDPPGLRATFRAADSLLAAGVHAMVVTLPRGEDPDSVLRSGGEAGLSAYLEDAVDVLERKLQILERQGYLATIEGRRRAVDGLLSTLRAVKDPALLDLYLGQAAERTGVRRETLVSEVARGRQARRVRRRSTGRTEDERPQAVESVDVETAAERGLVMLLIRDPSLVEAAAEAGLERTHFRDARLRAIYEALHEGEAERMDRAELRCRLQDDAATLFDELVADSTEIVQPQTAFEQNVRRIVHREWLERLRQIDRELELADAGHARQLLAEKDRIARELREAGVSLSFVRRYGNAVPTPTPR